MLSWADLSCHPTFSWYYRSHRGGKGVHLTLKGHGCHMLPCAAVVIGRCKAGCLSESWERSPKYAPLHCPQTGLFWVLLQFLLRRGGNLGDTASGFGYKELPLPSLQPDGSSLQWGPLPVMGSTVPSWTSLGSGREQQAELCVGVRLSMVCQEG